MLDSTDAADITDTPINVAVIDDNRADSRFLERLLTGLSGWKIDASVYDSPDNALPHLKESPPDVLFVDYLLGHEMTGIDVMERFQAEGINSAFILMTGHGSEKVAADALRTGAKDYLIKDTLTAENLDRSLRYVSERKKSDETIQGLALSDALTGLANRNAFNRRMDDALKVANREGTSVALMLMDLDKFKPINDTFGHLIGDEFLKLVAGVLNDTTREIDTVARFGGDEFAIILTSLKDTEPVAHVAERIVHSLSQPVTIDGCLIQAGASAGISLYPKDTTDVEELFDYADKALYAVKEAGRNNFQFFDAGMNEKANAERVLENDIKLALEQNDFLPYFQPQLDISKNQVIGVEALARWQHPERGLLMPAEFIEAAETNGLIIELSEQLIRETCRQGKAWQSAGIAPFRMSVNISPAQFKDENFVAMLEAFLTETGFDSQWLELEITENLMMEDVDRAVDWLQRLREVGVNLAVGNFGTGHSSLANLMKFPVQKLKIGRFFIDQLGDEKSDAAITDAMIKLGQCLDLEVIAEGVESQHQVDALAAMDCHKVQGFFCCKPMPADAFLAWMSDR
jgi:diguanylate cyclase (GGDEF)-like protein